MMKLFETTPKASDEIIQQMVNFIAERFHPEKVILFGSYARGDANEHSDVDLLVILNETGPHGEKAASILSALGRAFCIPVDVFVRTPNGVEQFKDQPHSLVHTALKEGAMLYAK